MATNPSLTEPATDTADALHVSVTSDRYGDCVYLAVSRGPVSGADEDVIFPDARVQITPRGTSMMLELDDAQDLAHALLGHVRVRNLEY